jgi:hypothetical protein
MTLFLKANSFSFFLFLFFLLSSFFFLKKKTKVTHFFECPKEKEVLNVKKTLETLELNDFSFPQEPSVLGALFKHFLETLSEPLINQEICIKAIHLYRKTLTDRAQVMSTFSLLLSSNNHPAKETLVKQINSLGFSLITEARRIPQDLAEYERFCDLVSSVFAPLIVWSDRYRNSATILNDVNDAIQLTNILFRFYAEIYFTAGASSAPPQVAAQSQNSASWRWTKTSSNVTAPRIYLSKSVPSLPQI